MKQISTEMTAEGEDVRLVSFWEQRVIISVNISQLTAYEWQVSQAPKSTFVYWLFDSICNHNLQKEDQAVINKTYN